MFSGRFLKVLEETKHRGSFSFRTLNALVFFFGVTQRIWKKSPLVAGSLEEEWLAPIVNSTHLEVRRFSKL